MDPNSKHLENTTVYYKLIDLDNQFEITSFTLHFTKLSLNKIYF